MEGQGVLLRGAVMKFTHKQLTILKRLVRQESVYLNVEEALGNPNIHESEEGLKDIEGRLDSLYNYLVKNHKD